MMKKEIFIFDSVALSPFSPESDAVGIVAKKIRSLGVSLKDRELQICKKSVDARKKDDIKLIFSVALSGESFSERERAKFERLGARRALWEELSFNFGEEKMAARPLVVGMGPAGMFCALILAEQGYKPIIIDRGDRVDDRVAAMERFYTTHVLDTESNVQFGAGGAGTFSDGKLLTRINDPKISYVLDTFARFGAPEEIRIKAKPHIGTDILRRVVDNILTEIGRLGGEVIYRCRLDDLSERADGTVLAKTTKGEFVASAVVLRIEHKRSFSEDALYGSMAGHPNLGAAEYALSDTKGERGVYTFCMCPGGEVMAAASEADSVVVNGMSHYARDGVNSNSAVAVSVQVSDIAPVEGNAALGAIEFQRKIERAAFAAGGGGYAVPVQTVGDFMSGKSGSEPREVMPTYMQGQNFKTASMDDVLPDFVCRSLRYGLASFDKKIKGFASETALLSGAETRTSSPLRILRGENMTALGKKSIYPCGEGAGYAGGITSAAVDGVKIAMAIISRFSPLD